MADNLSWRVKELVDISKSKALTELEKRLLEIKNHCLEIEKENLRLKFDLVEIQNNINQSKALTYDKSLGVYYLDDGSAICQLCFDHDGKIIHLQPWDDFYQCFACGRNYYPVTSRRTPSVRKDIRPLEVQ